MRFVSFAFALLVVLSCARRAGAQQIELKAGAEPTTIEVGEVTTYTVFVMVHGGGEPADVKPGPTNGMTMLGRPSAAPVKMRMSVNGRMSENNGLTTSWRMRGDREGTFTLGPATVVVNGVRKALPPVRVTVVGRGKAPKRPANDPFAGTPFAGGGGGGAPFDPFKGFGIFDFGDDDNKPREPALATADPKLSMDTPRQPVAFLHATIDKTRVVVGEQVTLTVYLYEDPFAHQGHPGDVHEPTANEFVKKSLVEDETRAVGLGSANVGGKLWDVKLVRKNALFPVKTGHLEIEPMSLTLPQARVGLRESERLAVDVSEPPVDGRPPGYAIGDVGDMALSATITPRSIVRDGAIGVTIELRGTGNLPSQLTLPAVPGVEWLEPQPREKLGAQQNDRFGGTRTFSYVVRIHREGAVDLGELRLPFYDPDKRAYGVARASLGIVNVGAGTGRDAGVDEPEIVLGGMPKERHALEGAHPQKFLSEAPWFWAALFGSPLACALGIGASTFLRRARERRENAAPSPARVAKEKRAEADAACKKEDGAAAMGAIARAVQADVLARTGVNLRGAALDDGEEELVEAGVTSTRAREIADVLKACEDARFSPDGVAIDQARTLWEKARATVDALGASKTEDAR